MSVKSTIPSFREATENGTVTRRDGYHQPGSGHRGRPRCGCSNTTDKGAYRDVTAEYDGLTVHFYHQSAVVTELPDGRLVLDNHGYKTATTKERINRYLPSGYRVAQQDYTWYLETPEGREEFSNGMTINP